MYSDHHLLENGILGKVAAQAQTTQKVFHNGENSPRPHILRKSLHKSKSHSQNFIQQAKGLWSSSCKLTNDPCERVQSKNIWIPSGVERFVTYIKNLLPPPANFSILLGFDITCNAYHPHSTKLRFSYIYTQKRQTCMHLHNLVAQPPSIRVLEGLGKVPMVQRHERWQPFKTLQT